MSTPAEAEATAETTTFDHFGKTWTVPAKQRLSHMLAYRQALNYYANVDLAMCHAYLTEEDMQALLKVDPTDDELDAFTDAMSKALGFGGTGNS